MSDFENFLCFSSATAQRCGTGTAEAHRGKTKKVFKIAHIIWPLMKETKNVSFTKETIGFYFQRAILEVDSLCSMTQ